MAIVASSTFPAVVIAVRAGGPGADAKPGLEAGDVIMGIQDSAVTCLDDLDRITVSWMEGKKERVPALVRFDRGDRTFLSVVKLGVEELQDPWLEATKGWLPADVEVISRDLAAYWGQPTLKGFYVTRVLPGGTAEKAGLRAGDFLTGVDGEALTASAPEHREELAVRLRQYDPGTVIPLNVIRGNQPIVLQVEVAASPRSRREMRRWRSDDFEFTVRDIAMADRMDAQWPADQTGVLVEEVRPGGWAELGMLYASDLILQIDGQDIRDVQALQDKMEPMSRTRPQFVVMKVLRGIHTRYLAFEPKWNL